MVELNQYKKVLPLFREDLELFQGPDNPDGSPSFNIHDPIKGQYYKISWGESLIIKHLKPGMTINDLCESLNSKTTLKVTPDEIKYYFEDAAKHNLLSLPRSSSVLINESENKKTNPITWLLFHYLYIRVPLFDPNEFLKKTLKYVKPLASTNAFIIYSLLSIIGIIFLLPRVEEFAHTFTYFFNLKGFITYALALTAVKIIHEFSHAYTAVNFHVRVPSMGVVFLVMWPVLYTDVTDGWKLKNRTDRLYISLAGIIAETVIAGLCTLGWVLTSHGLLKSIFFVVSAVSWVSTLFVNANPAMRFDGYYILSDLWGVDNLQPRAFAIARWKLRDWILGLKLQCPEPNIPEKLVRGMVIYSICTWVYRLVLYTTIAVFIYYSFTKAIGLFLFFLEIGIFIAWPLYSEARIVYLLRKKIKNKRRLYLIAFTSCLLFLWVAIPLPRNEYYSAVTIPHLEQVLYAPYDSIIEKINVKKNQQVSRNEKIIKLSSKKLEIELEGYKIDAKMIEQKIKILGLEDTNFSHIPEKTRELEGILAKSKEIQSKIDELTLTAGFDGKVISWNEDLKANQSVSKDLILGKIADVNQMDVMCFVPESLLNTVSEGQKVEFILKGGTHFSGKIEKIHHTRARKLFYPALASIYKGNIPVKEDSNGNLILIDSYFPVEVRLYSSDITLSYGKVGTILVQGPKRSIFLSLIKNTISIFWRESGF